MKTFTAILILLGIGLIAYNLTLVDFNNPLVGDSLVAIIGVVAALCAIVLLVILNLSKKIQDKVNNK